MKQEDRVSENKNIPLKKLKGKLSKAIKEHKSLTESISKAELELEKIKEFKIDQEIDAEIFKAPPNKERAKMEAELLNFHHANVIYLRTLNESSVDEFKGGQEALQIIEKILEKRESVNPCGNEDSVMMMESDATQSEVNKNTKRKKSKRKKEKAKACKVEAAEQRNTDIERFAQVQVFVENTISQSLEEVKEEVTMPLDIQNEKITEDPEKNTIPESLEEISEESAELVSDHQNHSCETQEPEETKETELVETPAEHNSETGKVEKQVQTEECEEIKILQEQLLEREATIKEQQGELDKVSKELSDTKSLICDFQNQLLEKDNMIIELNGLREKDEGNYRARSDELSQELREKVSAFNQVNQELEGKNATIDQLNGELDGLKRELQRFKLHEQDMKKDLEEVKKLVERLHTEHQEELNAVNAQHTAELENLRLMMRKQQEEKYREMDELKQMYGSEVNNLNESFENQMKKNKDLKQEINRLTQDWDNSVARLKVKDASLEELKLKLKELGASSENEINSLRKELKDRDKEIADLEDKLSSFEEQLVLQLSSTSRKCEKKFAEERAQIESQCKEMMQDLFDMVKRLELDNNSLQAIHAQEIEVLRDNLDQNSNGLNSEMHELKSTAEKACQDELLAFVAKLGHENQQEISQLKKDLLQESEEKIASIQDALSCKIAKAEEENVLLRNKLISLDKDLSEITGERNKFFDEIEGLRDTRRMLEETMSLLEQSMSAVSSQGVHEGPIPVQECVEGMKDVPGHGFNEGALNKTNLTFKLEQLRELVCQKNNLDLKLSQDLQETKKELEKERENFRAELHERETLEQALEGSKKQLETQLTVMDKENCELLRELSLLQKDKKSNFLRRWFKCLRKQDS